MADVKINVEVNNKKVKTACEETRREVGRTTDAINKSGKNIDGFFTKIGRNFDNIKNNLVSGFKAIAVGAYGFQAAMEGGAFLTNMVKATKEFNVAMKEVSTISKDVTENMDGYKAQLIELTSRVPIGATEAAKALYQIVSAGQQGEDALKVLEISAKAAIGGVTDTATAADTITTILNAYHKSASEAQHVSDLLFTTVKNGKTTMSELGQSIANAAPTAAAYGISIEELLAAVATLTKQGVPTAVAMTQLNAVITQGVEVLGDGAFEGRTFAEALGEIAEKAGGSMSALKGDVSNIRAMKAVLSMTGEGAASAAKDLQDMADAAGASEEAFGKNADTKAMQRLQNDIQGAIEPIITNISKLGKETANALADSLETGEIKNYVAAIEGLVAAYGVYRTAVIVNTAYISLQNSVLGGHTARITAQRIAVLSLQKAQALLNATMLSNPYVAMAAALGLCVGALIKHANELKANVIAQNELNAAEKEHNKQLTEAKENIDELINQAQDDADATTKRNEAIANLTLKYGDIIKKYIDEEGHLQNIIGLKKELYEIETGKVFEARQKENNQLAKSVELLKHVRAGQYGQLTLSKGYDTEENKKALASLQKEYTSKTGKSALDINEMRSYYGTKYKGTNYSLGRDMTKERVNRFAMTLGGMDDEKLKKVQSELQAAQLKAVNNIAVKYQRVGDALTADDIKVLLTQVDGIISSRSQKKKTTRKTKEEIKAEAKAAKEAKEAAKDAQALQDLIEETNRSNERQSVEEILATDQARIDAMKEGRAKVVAQMELDLEKELAAIQRETDELKAAREEEARKLWEAQNAEAVRKGQTWSNSGAQQNFRDAFKFTDQEASYFQAKLGAAQAAYDKTFRDLLDQDLAQMREYMQNFGTDAQKAYAIGGKYDDQIAKAETEWERKNLQAQKASELSQVKAQALAGGIDWASVTRGVGGIVTSIADATLAKLDAYMQTSEFKNLSAQDKQAYTDLRAQVYASSTTSDKSAFNFGVWGEIESLGKLYQESLQEVTRANNAHQEAIDRLQAADTRLAQATDETAKKMAEAERAAAEAEVNATAVALSNAQANNQKAQTDLTTTTESAAQGLQNFANSVQEINNGSLYGFAHGIAGLIDQLAGTQKGAGGAAKALEGLGGKVGGIIGAILQIIDALGDAPAAFIQSILDKVAEVVEAIISQLPQIIAAIITGIKDIITGFGAGLASWFGLGGGNMEDLNEQIAELTASNKDLEGALDDLKDEIQAGNVKDAQENYDKALAVLTESMNNASQIMKDEAGKWETGSHSIGSQLNNDSEFRNYLAQVSAILGKSVGSTGEFLGLSASDLKTLREKNPELYRLILAKFRSAENSHTGSGIDEMINDYINTYGDAFDELANMLNEKLAGTTFDNIKDNFASLLKTMSTTSQDWADNFEDMLRNAVINGLADSFSEELEAWYKDFAEAMQNGEISQAERDALRAEYDNIVAKAEAKRDAIYDTLGIKDSSGSASASVNAVQSVSEDTASDIVGRMTAIQIAQEKGRAYQEAIAGNIERLVGLLDFTNAGGQSLQEIRNLLITSNQYLDDVARYTKASYNVLADKLAKIETNTAKI